MVQVYWSDGLRLAPDQFTGRRRGATDGAHAAVCFRFADVFMAGTGSGLSQSYRLHCGQTLGSFRFRFSHA